MDSLFELMVELPVQGKDKLLVTVFTQFKEADHHGSTFYPAQFLEMVEMVVNEHEER